MQKQVYEDYKYVMMDTGSLYIGSKFTYGELMENETLPFKFMTIIERYIIPDMGVDTTVEGHLYYMQPGDFTYRTLLQLKAKVKVSRLVIKKKLFGKQERVYSTEIMSLQDFAGVTPDEKERNGIFVQELVISKLAMMTFVV